MKFLGDSGRQYDFAKNEVTIGVSSRIPHSKKHIILLDYDKTDDAAIESDLRKAIDKFGNFKPLSSFYILKSSRGKRHAICFTRATLNDYLAFCDVVDIDPNHRYYTKKNGFGVLRITRKANKKSSSVKLVKVIEGNGGKEDLKLKQEYFKLLGFEGK